jgi:hypothetical protein
MYKIFILIVSCLTVISASAQDTIKVKKDPRLDVLTAKQIAMNKRNAMKTSSGQYKGFRVQVLSTSDRTKALTTKSELLTKFPEEKVYTMFQAPYFKIRMGNFLKREDAEAFRKTISYLFPQGAFVVADVIEYTPPEEDDLIIE